MLTALKRRLHFTSYPTQTQSLLSITTARILLALLLAVLAVDGYLADVLLYRRLSNQSSISWMTTVSIKHERTAEHMDKRIHLVFRTRRAQQQSRKIAAEMTTTSPQITLVSLQAQTMTACLTRQRILRQIQEKTAAITALESSDMEKVLSLCLKVT